MNGDIPIRGVIPQKLQRLWKVLSAQDYGWGVRAEDVAQTLSMPRRTVNRYLKVLNDLGRARRKGWHWFAEGRTWDL